MWRDTSTLKLSPGTRELIAIITGLPNRRILFLENSDNAIPLLSTLSKPHRCDTVCRRLNVCGAVIKHVHTVWQERAISHDS